MLVIDNVNIPILIGHLDVGKQNRYAELVDIEVLFFLRSRIHFSRVKHDANIIIPHILSVMLPSHTTACYMTDLVQLFPLFFIDRIGRF